MFRLISALFGSSSRARKYSASASSVLPWASSNRPSEKWPLGRWGSISMAVSMCLSAGIDLASLGLDLSQADQRLDIIGVALQGGAVAGFGFGEPVFELQDHPKRCLASAEVGDFVRQLQQLEPGLFVIAAIDGFLGVLAELPGFGRAVPGQGCCGRNPAAHTDPTASGLGRKQP